jgi:hypothetical protein
MSRLARRSRAVAALATLLVSAGSVLLTAAAPASAVVPTTVVWQNTSSGGGSWIYQPTPGCTTGSCYFQSSMRNLFTPSTSGNVTKVTVSAFTFSGTLTAHGSIEIRTANNYPSDTSTLISASTGVVVGSDLASEVYTMSPGTIAAGTQYELIERATDASLNFIVNDGGSGLSGYMYTGNDAGGVGTFSGMGGAGIKASVSIGPLPLSASATVTPASPNGSNGWYRTTPTVNITCAGDDPATDCPAPATVADGLHTPVIGVVHNAGGETAAYFGPGMQVDTVAPTATPTLTGTLGSNGWYTSAVALSWHCTDVTSGVASCPADSTVTDQDRTVTGPATDLAGNTAPDSVEVKSDTIAPAISGTIVTPAAADGLYDGPVTVHWTCTDTVSGVAACPADAIVTGVGSDTNATATVRDLAGNSATATLTGLVRRAIVVPPTAAKTSVTSYVLHGLPAKFRSGKAVLLHGKAYHLTVTTTGGQSGPANAPSWLRAVKTNSSGTSGKPDVVAGTCHIDNNGSYACTFVVTKAMRGSFRKFGLQAPDGTVTYKTVYIR